MTLSEIARLCGASHNLTAELANTEPQGFAIDSRAVKAGDVFIALPGERVDGDRLRDELDRRDRRAGPPVRPDRVLAEPEPQRDQRQRYRGLGEQRQRVLDDRR